MESKFFNPAVIAEILTGSNHHLEVRFEGSDTFQPANLRSWIGESGGTILHELQDEEFFKEKARISDCGRFIYWGDPDGDLSIDAHHVWLRTELPDEQFAQHMFLCMGMFMGIMSKKGLSDGEKIAELEEVNQRVCDLYTRSKLSGS